MKLYIYLQYFKHNINWTSFLLCERDQDVIVVHFYIHPSWSVMSKNFLQCYRIFKKIVFDGMLAAFPALLRILVHWWLVLWLRLQKDIPMRIPLSLLMAQVSSPPPQDQLAEKQSDASLHPGSLKNSVGARFLLSQYGTSTGSRRCHACKKQ